MNRLLVFFPYPKMTWEDAFQWAKERNMFGAKTIQMANPNHWDRENILKEKNSLLTENTFAWDFGYGDCPEE